MVSGIVSLVLLVMFVAGWVWVWRPARRDEFEAVKAMAQKAREENEQLKQRVALLEEVLEELEADIEEPPTPRPIRRRKVKRSY